MAADRLHGLLRTAVRLIVPLMLVVPILGDSGLLNPAAAEKLTRTMRRPSPPSARHQKEGVPAGAFDSCTATFDPAGGPFSADFITHHIQELSGRDYPIGMRGPVLLETTMRGSFSGTFRYDRESDECTATGTASARPLSISRLNAARAAAAFP